MNPMNLMKLAQARSQFENTHPKFCSFVSNMFGHGIEEGTIVEVTVTKPGGIPVTTNMKVQASDLELFEQIKELAK